MENLSPFLSSFYLYSWMIRNELKEYFKIRLKTEISNDSKGIV